GPAECLGPRLPVGAVFVVIGHAPARLREVGRRGGVLAVEDVEATGVHPAHDPGQVRRLVDRRDGPAGREVVLGEPGGVDGPRLGGHGVGSPALARKASSTSSAASMAALGSGNQVPEAPARSPPMPLLYTTQPHTTTSSLVV